MSLKIAGSTTLGAVVGGALGVLGGAMLGVDLEGLLEEIQNAAPELENLPENFEEHIKSAAETIKKVDPAFFSELDKLDDASKISEVALPDLNNLRFPDLGGLTTETLLNPDQISAYEYLKDNWNTLGPAVEKLAVAQQDSILASSVGGTAGAAVGGYAGYKLAGGGSKPSWTDRVEQGRTARGPLQPG